MKPTTLLSTLLLTTTTLALPTSTSTTSAPVTAPTLFTAHAALKTSPYKTHKLHASNTGFWLGNATRAECMNETTEAFYPCAQETLFSFGPGYTGLGLGSEVPGGQYAYVGPFGALRFTLAHLESDALPAGSEAAGFEQEWVGGRWTMRAPAGAAWQACPVEGVEGVQSVFADLGRFGLEGCEEFDMVMVNATETATTLFQYE